MKTNLTTENYEAYLLDYMEGNLGPDETEQLKAFVAAQDLDWDELTAPLPYLTAPEIAYENKEKLKKGAAVVPLYVKIASAAAAAGLLLTVSLWPDKSMPELKPLAELKPILPQRLITESEATALPPRTIQFVYPQAVKKAKPAFSKTVSENLPERVETPLVAQLEPQKAQILPALPTSAEPDFELLAYQMNANLAYGQLGETAFDENEDDGRELSFIGKGIFRLTNGKYDSFASLIGAGVHKAKQDLTEAATDVALAAYYRAEESFEETRGRWEEKRGE